MIFRFKWGGLRLSFSVVLKNAFIGLTVLLCHSPPHLDYYC